MQTTDTTILTINASDSSGQSGIQSDIRTISSLGARAVTAITSVTVQSLAGISRVAQVPADVVVGQIKAVCEDVCPAAVKVGMVNHVETIRQMCREIASCPNIVCSLVILAADGSRLMDERAVVMMADCILPISRLLIMKCHDVALLLGMEIHTDADMLLAARRLHDMGAQWVMLRGGQVQYARVTALLYGEGFHEFFTSYNIEGWQKHGIAGTLSTAITARLAMDTDVPTAIRNAHKYLHSQIVYAVNGGKDLRPQELYNRFLSYIAAHYTVEHEVAFYASALAITTRYLSHITRQMVGKTPKSIIDDYLLNEARRLLFNTSLSVQEISNHLGFSSAILFSRFIRKKSGQTPKEIRRSDQQS